MFKSKYKPTIKFHTSEKLLKIIPHPVKAAKAMPEWFRKIKPEIDGADKAEAGTIKRCMPVLDAVSQGYIIPLWADLQVKVGRMYNFKDADGKVVHQEATDKPEDLVGTETVNTNELMSSYEDSGGLAVFMRFPELDMGLGDLISNHAWEQVGNSCDLKKFKLGKVLLKFSNPWTIETPKGWSVKFQNPANNWSNDLQLIEGVVDTDDYYNKVNFPYVWAGSEVGEFIIPRGTPLVHIIPFERKSMDLEVGVEDVERAKAVNMKLLTKHFDKYKTFFWKKKI